MMITVHLKPGREKSVVQGHPWLYSGAIAETEGAEDAPLARVVSADGKPLGTGFWSPRSQIRVRLLTGAGDEPVDRAFFAARLAEAIRLRAAVIPGDTTGYRVFNAEGDGVPGWTVDRFGSTLVGQITVAGLEAVRGEAYAALADAFPGYAILQTNSLPARRGEGLRQDDEVIAGEPGEEAAFTESGLAFTADLAGGQKTGFYCDQRENRRLAERLAAGREMLDLFAHTGAFGLYALRGGAARVVHVESAARLVERGERHYRLNGFDPAAGHMGTEQRIRVPPRRRRRPIRPGGVRPAAPGAPSRRPRPRRPRLQGPQPPGLRPRRPGRLPPHLLVQRRGRRPPLPPDPLRRRR